MFTLCEMLRFLFCFPDSVSAGVDYRFVPTEARGGFAWVSQMGVMFTFCEMLRFHFCFPDSLSAGVDYRFVETEARGWICVGFANGCDVHPL